MDEPTTESAIHPTLAAALDALEQIGAESCLLRGEAELASPPGDVDLLVSATDLGRIRNALAPLGFAPVPAWGRGSHRFFVAYDEVSDRWLKLDLVSELAYGRHQAFWTRAAPECLARRRRAGALAVLAPDDAFWTLLLHCLLDRGDVPPHHRERLLELVAEARSDGPLGRVVGAACPAGWDSARILDRARAGDWPALTALARELKRRWSRRHPIEVWPRVLRNGTLQHATKLLTLLRRRGLSVALLGPDGAGKSTLAAGVEDSFFFPARALYAGLYPRGSARRRGVPGLRFAGRLLRLWRNCLVARYHQARGRLVVFDRYVYDALLPPTRELGARGRVRRWLLAHACPPADLVVLLDAPGELVFGRKGEHSVAVLDEQRRRYLELAIRLPQLVVVDAAQEAEDVRRIVTATIWRRYADRWLGWPRPPRRPLPRSRPSLSDPA